ncbi:MAG: TraB/GumN family protein, partial [Nitratireductor sp.]|nr:TraB/GumN family protein [Nitratireductor sp.]
MNPFATRSKSAFIALADRHGERLLAAAAGLMALFFISFLWVLAQAVSAQAGMACGGSDLVARYQSEEPETYARLAAEAAAEVNGGHVFWRLEKDGVQPSYLLGTMHMSDVRIARLEGARLAAFNAADTVIVESVEALIEEKAAAAMLQYRNLTLYTDGTTLADRLDAR